MLEVDQDAVFKDRHKSLLDELRGLFRKSQISYKELRSDSKGVFFKTDANVAQILRKLPAVTWSSSEGAFHVLVKDQESVMKEVDSKSIEVLRKRVDSSGTKEPLIQPQGKDQILLQMPGLKDSISRAL